MAQELLMARRGPYLAPWGPMDAGGVEVLPHGKPLKVKVTRARSVPQHRLYWSMLNLVADNMDTPVTADALHEWIKLRCGVSIMIPLRSGKIDVVPGSIAFDKMEQTEFQQFFDKAKTLIVEHLIPGLGIAALESEARLMLGEMA